jgi:hypothetical protein
MLASSPTTTVLMTVAPGLARCNNENRTKEMPSAAHVPSFSSVILKTMPRRMISSTNAPAPSLASSTNATVQAFTPVSR